MGVEFIRAVQSIHSPLLDRFFIAVTSLGNEMFYILALPFIYWIVSKKARLRMGALFLFSAWLNGALKEFFAHPRPDAEEVRVLFAESGDGYGFPSGHAQLSATFWGALSLEVRRTALTAGCVALILLIGFSRIYLGLHFLYQVLWGFMIGAGVLLLGVLIAKWAGNISPHMVRDLALAVLFPLALMLIIQTEHSLKTAGYLLGFLFGVILEREFLGWNVDAPVLKQVVKYIFGLVVMMLIGQGLKIILPPSAVTVVLRYGLMGTWVSLGAPYLFRKIGLEAD